MYRRFHIFWQWSSRLIVAASLLVGFGSPALSTPQKTWENPKWSSATFSRIDRKPPIFLAKEKTRSGQTFDNLPPEEKARIQRQYREWQSLPPNQKDTMRRRMDEWNRMPSQERDRYQQRYQQFQQLSPDERQQLDKNLRRWDNLSPQERDSIRQRFKN